MGREGSDWGFGSVKAVHFGLVSSVFWAGAPLGAWFSCYAGAPRPSSQARRWKL